MDAAQCIKTIIQRKVTRKHQKLIVFADVQSTKQIENITRVDC